jgi:hypothetical protein
MRRLIFAALALALASSPALASKSTDTMKACAAAWKAMSPADQAKTTYKAYSTTCLKNGGPPAPATTAAATPMTPQQRMKDCAAKWDALKKAGKTNGQTYQQFSKVCLKAS